MWSTMLIKCGKAHNTQFAICISVHWSYCFPYLFSTSLNIVIAVLTEWAKSSSATVLESEKKSINRVVRDNKKKGVQYKFAEMCDSLNWKNSISLPGFLNILTQSSVKYKAWLGLSQADPRCCRFVM